MEGVLGMTASDPSRTPAAGNSLVERALLSVTSEADPWFAVTTVLDLIVTDMDCDWLGVITPESMDQAGLKILAFRDSRPGDPPRFDVASAPALKEALGRCLETRLPVRIDEETAGPGSGDGVAPYNFGSAALFPIAQGNEALGVLTFMGSRSVVIPPMLELQLPGICTVVALALRNLTLSGQLERQELFGQCSEQLVAMIARGSTEQELYAFLSGFLGAAFGTDMACIGTFSDDGQWVILQSVHDTRKGSEPRTLQPIRVGDERESGGTPNGGIIDRPDLTLADVPEAWRQYAAEAGVGSLFAVPLADPGGIWGLAILADEETGAVLGPRDRQLFRILIQHASPLLQNSRIMRDLRHSVEGFQLLFETSREVSSVLSLTEVPRIMAQRAMDLSQSDECLVLLLEPDGRTLKPVLALSEYQAEMMQIEAQIGEGITGYVASTRAGEYVNRVDLDPRSRHIPGTPVTMEALLSVPLICAHKLIGVMSLYKLDGRQYTDLDLATITIFATQAAIAIENARLFESVAAERTRLSTMIQQMEEAVFFCDGGGTILVVNSAAQMLAGREEPLAGTAFTEALNDEMRETLTSIVQDLRTKSGRNITREFPFAGRFVLGSFTAIRDEKDGMTGLVVLCKDITDLKAMESQLLQSSKMSAVGQLASGVAHEFNNLIAAIYGYAQFMKDNRDERILTKGINIILNSSERARDLTRSLLTFSRNSEGRFEAVDLNEVIDDAILLVEQQLTKEGIRLVRDYGRLPHAWADRGRLQEVFLNLISNSRHAMPNGGTITLATRPEEDRLVAEVTDTGSGIPPENIGRIFDPFFTTKGPLGGARTPGTGLGLFTVYNTVTAHGGKVEVSSESEKGTRVRLLLPSRVSPPCTPPRPADITPSGPPNLVRRVG
jgi:PAS domain S-box-containing protein